MTQTEANPVDAFDPTAPRPWHRFFAKLIDISLYSIMIVIMLMVIFIVLELLGVEIDYEWSKWFERLVINPAVTVVACLIDGIFLHLVGTSVGRVLFAIDVRHDQNKAVPLGAALRRGLKLSAMGLGLGLPLLSLIMLIVSYRQLTSERITPWDKSENFQITYRETGEWRLAGQILAVLLAVAFQIAANAL